MVAASRSRPGTSSNLLAGDSTRTGIQAPHPPPTLASASWASGQARLTGEAEPQVFTDPDGDGVFTASFLFLIPGSDYEVSVELQDGVSYNFSTDPVSPQALTVGSGAEASAAFEVTSASAS